MSIRPHPTRAGWYVVDYYPDGRKGKRERIPFEGYDAALAFQQAVKSGPAQQAATHPRLADVADEYLAWVERYQSAETYQNKRRRLPAWIIPALGQYRVRDLSQPILDRYGATMPAGSYRADIHHLLALVRWMVKRNLAEPLTWKPELPAYTPPVKIVPPPDKILACIAALPRPDTRALFSLMLYTALRWNEIRQLRWEQFTGQAFLLLHSKTKLQELIVIPDHLLPWYQQNRKPAGPVFSYTGATPYKSLERALNTAAASVGIHMTPHLFRHASATFLYEQTEDIYAVQHHLRHSRVTTSQIYTRYSTTRRREAVQTLVDYVDKESHGK